MGWQVSIQKTCAYIKQTMNSTHDDNFEHLDELLLDLKILGEVGQHEKISTKTAKITVQPDGFYLAFMRFITRESRENNLRRIKDLLCKSAREIDEFTSGRRCNPVVLERIRTHLLGAREGIDNLCYTYQADVNIKSELGQQIDKLDDQVRKITQFQESSSRCVVTIRKKSV